MPGYFLNYAAVWVKRPGRKEPMYACQPRSPALGFMCGACGKKIIEEGHRWRCKCGARVVSAIPNWYAEQMARARTR